MAHEPSKGYMTFQKKGDKLYGIHSRTYRKDSKICHDDRYIGRVIDQSKNIFKNMERGIFTYSIDVGYGDIPSEYNDYINKSYVSQNFAIDFGDTWLFSEILKKSGLDKVFQEAINNKKDYDTFISLVAYKILDKEAYQYASEWWDSSFIKIIYPDANIKSQRISEFLNVIGTEYYWKRLITTYLNYISTINLNHPILIDSIGLPNDIKIDLTAINNYNGMISNEIRLILVLDRTNGLPLYFRYVSGNIVDVTTLRATISELEMYNVNIEHLIIDAGYYSNNNLEELHKLKIPYIIRMCSNRKQYKQLVKENLNDLEKIDNYVSYRDRNLYCKMVNIKILDTDCYAYIMLDLERKFDEVKKYLKKFGSDSSISKIDKEENIKSKGIFIIISKEKYDINFILPLYYTRQKIEQTFYYGKNNASLLPLRVHNADSLRGHLLLSFMSTIVYVIFNNMLSNSNFSAMGAFHLFKCLKASISSNSIVINEPNKKMNDIIKHLKLSLNHKWTLDGKNIS
jgi:hypothetical protein